MKVDLKFDIRTLDERDAQAFRAIRLMALKMSPENFGASYEMEVERPIDYFIDGLKSSKVFAAFSEKRVVGMVGFAQEKGIKQRHKGVLWGMFVDPAYRGHRIGTSLLEALIAHERGSVEQIVLTAVGENTAAIKLYSACGFETYGTEPRALKHDGEYFDEILMLRYLD